jgi:lysophospholipase L1-like esterase
MNQLPNLILLMAGTNDINRGRTPEQAIADLDLFITYVFQRCPDATILVQHIPAIEWKTFGRTMSDLQMNVIKYNAAIPHRWIPELPKVCIYLEYMAGLPHSSMLVGWVESLYTPTTWVMN